MKDDGAKLGIIGVVLVVLCCFVLEVLVLGGGAAAILAAVGYESLAAAAVLLVAGLYVYARVRRKRTDGVQSGCTMYEMPERASAEEERPSS